MEPLELTFSCKLHESYGLLINGNQLKIINLYLRVSIFVVVFVLMSDGMVDFKMQQCIFSSSYIGSAPTTFIVHM